MEISWVFFRLRILFFSVIVMVGVLFQCSAIFLIFFDIDMSFGLQQHVFSSLLLAIMYKQFLPKHYRQESVRVVLLLWGVLLLFPLVGIVGLFLAMLLPAYFLKIEKENVTMVTDMPILPEDMSFDWWGDSAYKIDPMLEKKRLLMKMASQKLESKESIDVIRKEMCNPVDEVRLLAYSLIDRKAKSFNDRISLSLKKLDEVVGDDKIILYEQMAFDHWGLVYLGLAQGDVLAHLLRMSNKYAKLAVTKECGQDQASLFLLLAKIALRMEDKVAATEYLSIAEELGMPYTQLLIYWAEVAFVSGRMECMSAHVERLHLSYVSGKKGRYSEPVMVCI